MNGVVLAARTLLAATLLLNAHMNMGQNTDLRTSESLRMFVAEDMADPFVFQDGGWFYCFGTGNPGKMMRTKTFRPGDMTRYELKIDYAHLSRHQDGVWAFRPYKHSDGTYHAYGTVHLGHYRTVIAHFVPAGGGKWEDGKPVVSWRLDKVLVGNRERKEYAYDGVAVRDRDGTLYLAYVTNPRDNPQQRDNIHIFMTRMKNPFSVDESFKPRVILATDGRRSEDRNPGYIQLVEGPIFHEIGGRFALSYSTGDWAADNYKVAVAWSDTLLPPEGQMYRKALVDDPANKWGNTTGTKEVAYLLQSQIRDWPNFVGHEAKGPGHANLVRLDGQDYLFFHAHYPPGVTGSPLRHLYRVPVRVNVAGNIPMHEWIRPVIPPPAGAEAAR